MKIGIIGVGNIGSTLGRVWVEAGHEIVFGVREARAPKVLDLLGSLGGKAKAQQVGRTITSADVVLLAIPGTAVAELVRMYSTEMGGKIIVDATNSFGQPEMHNMVVLKGSLPNTPIFRAFSTLAWETLADPRFGEEQADLFYCGESGDTREIIEGLIRDVGLRPVYIGGPEAAPLVDNMTRLFFTLVMQQGYSRRTAFRLVTDENG